MATFADWLSEQESRKDRTGAYARRAARYAEHFPTDGPWLIEESSGDVVAIRAQAFREVMNAHDDGAWAPKRDLHGNQRQGRGKMAFLEWRRSVDPEEV